MSVEEFRELLVEATVATVAVLVFFAVLTLLAWVVDLGWAALS